MVTKKDIPMTRSHEASLATYTFHKPQVFTLKFDELGQAVLRRHNERFQGTSIADHTKYREGQPLAFSNTLRALSYNQILHQLTNGRIQVASPSDVVRYWKGIPEINTTSADTNSIVLFSNQRDNQDLAQVVCGILDRINIDVPLLVAGLGVKKADNSRGFTFTETALTRAREAPYLKQNCRVRYDKKKDDLVIARDDEEGVRIWTSKDQSGLRRAYRDSGILYCGSGRLLDSYAGGRVQVVEKNLESQVK